jgi:hypothetical protein
LPAEVTTPLEGTLIGKLDKAELVRAFTVATAALVSEIAAVDEPLATRLGQVLVALAESVA